jgi:tetratricopeptide (TPR) repeat protein
LINNLEQVPLRWRYKYGETELSAPLLRTVLNKRFDVFGTRIFADEHDTVLFHNCGSCKNPTNSRWKECFHCIQTGAQAVGRIPEFIILVKMTTQKCWPSIDKDVFSIDEKIIGMSIIDLEKIIEIIDDIIHEDDLHKRILLCNKGIRINCWVAPLWAFRGEALYYLNDLEEALSCYEKAIQLVPDNKIFWFNRGFILKTLGKTEYALVSFEKALLFDPHDPYTLAMREDCLRALGKAGALSDETRFYEATCAHCGMDLPAYAAYCHNCGTPTENPSEKTCMYCGCSIPAIAQFCPHCGRIIGGDLTRLY